MPRGHRSRIRSLEDVDEAHLTIRAFADFLAVSPRQVWKWHNAGVLALVVPAGNRREARLHIDEARRFYSESRSCGAA